VNKDEDTFDIWGKSVELANIYGPKILEDVDGYAAEATTTAAVLLAHFCICSDVSMHAAVDLLMSSYKVISPPEEQGE
jgi:hypothetical protein